MIDSKKIIYKGKKAVDEWITNHPDQRLDLSNLRFDKYDFKGWRLSRSIFNNASFIDCNFSEADISEISALNTNFSGCDFNNASLNRSNFSGSNCTGADLSNANFHLATTHKVKWPNDIILK